MELKRRYTTEEVCELIPIDPTTLRHRRAGRKQGKDGKWQTPPILQKFKDYKMTVSNGRTKYIYYPSAIEKLRAYNAEQNK